MKCSVQGRTRNLPDFLVVGTARAGTTSLHRWLEQHPRVVVPRRTKETLFFHIATNPNRAQLRYLPHAITDFDEYLAQFDDVGDDQVCGEVCPSYLYFHEHTIANIRRLHPGWQRLKIVIVLREPVDKVVSHYRFVTNTLGIRDGSLERALRLEPERQGRDDVLLDLMYVRGATYSPQVKAFMDAFPHVRVFFYEQLRRDPAAFLADVCAYLGVEPVLPDDLDVEHNRSRGRRWPFRRDGVSDAVRARLKQTFREDVKRLEALLGRDLGFWGYG